MKTKRILALALAGAMVMSMAACGGNDSSNGTSSNTTSGDNGSTAESTVSVIEPNQDPANTEKSDEELVVGLAFINGIR